MRRVRFLMCAALLPACAPDLEVGRLLYLDLAANEWQPTQDGSQAERAANATDRMHTYSDFLGVSDDEEATIRRIWFERVSTQGALASEVRLSIETDGGVVVDVATSSDQQTDDLDLTGEATDNLLGISEDFGTANFAFRVVLSVPPDQVPPLTIVMDVHSEADRSP